MDEFTLIQQYFSDSQKTSAKNGTVLGIGDDAAILNAPAGESLLFTTDTLISGVHFPVDTEPHAIGHKALAVNLSDIAAMAGQARWFTLALTLPEADASWLKGFSQGIFMLAEQSNVSLIGGDTTRGPLSITISVLGTVPENLAVRRSAASPGDCILITGQPGMAALGLAALNGKLDLADEDRKKYIAELNYPQPRLAEGVFLRDFATSMIDVSDGLAADLGHILESSACSAVIDSEALTRGLSRLSDDRPLQAALHGGDDYELLFTVPEQKLKSLIKKWPQSYISLKQIGRIVEGDGLFIKKPGADTVKITASGYTHFNA